VLWVVLTAPGTLWLILLFLVPLYIVLAIVFGGVDPLFRTPIPVMNPLQWQSKTFVDTLRNIFGPGGFYKPAMVRTAVYVGSASVLSLLIAYPVAYYTARLAGSSRKVLLALLIAPFWISYMMRMLAWVNLLQNDGLVNKTLSVGGLFDANVDWLNGRSYVVVLGLVYGYVPYMILPLYAGLDRLQPNVLEAARDLGAGRFDTFRRVTLPLSRPAIIAAVLLTCLPMLGDYFTADLLSASPSTSMVGNLINTTVLTPGQTGAAGAFVLIVLLVSLLPMLFYVRSSRSENVAS
jgi:ABC-type spermidine/putrescine transport system permease subunit I